nr:hypothetical protein [Novosphingobium panipatense]
MILRVGPLADNPLDAAARFHAEVLPEARAVLARGSDLTLVFPAAARDHRGWRLAAVQELARQYAPLRVNALSGAEAAGVAATAEWLAGAESITGQYLRLDEIGAGSVVSPQQ